MRCHNVAYESLDRRGIAVASITTALPQVRIDSAAIHTAIGTVCEPVRNDALHSCERRRTVRPAAPTALHEHRPGSAIRLRNVLGLLALKAPVCGRNIRMQCIAPLGQAQRAPSAPWSDRKRAWAKVRACVRA